MNHAPSSWHRRDVPSPPAPGPWTCECGQVNPEYRYRCQYCRKLDQKRKDYQEAFLFWQRGDSRLQRWRRPGGVGQAPYGSVSDPSESAVDRKVRTLERSIADLEAAGLDAAALRTQLDAARRERIVAIPLDHRLESVRARVEMLRRALADATARSAEAEQRRSATDADLQLAVGELRATELSLATPQPPQVMQEILRMAADLEMVPATISPEQAAALHAAMPPTLAALLFGLQRTGADALSPRSPAPDSAGAGTLVAAPGRALLAAPEALGPLPAGAADAVPEDRAAEAAGFARRVRDAASESEAANLVASRLQRWTASRSRSR